jgi:DNA replication and repair protein RecF
MYAKELAISNFRNYKEATLSFSRGKNIIIGENAQGKTNLIEAIDLLSSGKSSRAGEERELVRWSSANASIKLEYHARGYDESLSMDWKMKSPSAPNAVAQSRAQKTMFVNGVQQQSVKGILGRLLTVSFSAEDLNLLRGGPKYRRDWLDNLAIRLHPSFHDVTSSYAKSVMQRNKLLKTLAEKGRLSVSDQDELLVWDKQLARFGTQIIKMRLDLLASLLPIAESEQAHLSRSQERLSIDYAFRAQETVLQSNSTDEEDDDDSSSSTELAKSSEVKSMSDVRAMENVELARYMMKLMRERRWLELRRKQSLVGPHRDNLIFKLNDADAASFASQGQQRSIVLSLKLAELRRIQDEINEPPILLLDDVLAELDERRAQLLLSTVGDQMQTIMSTTHLSGIDSAWLNDAKVMTVHAGALKEDCPA